MGGALLPIIITSDKTNINVMSGGKVAYSLLILTALFTPKYCSKFMNNAYELLALIPVVEFLHPDERIVSMLFYHFFHQCKNFVLEPMMKAVSIGILLEDPLGYMRKFYPVLAACIMDTPESHLIAARMQNTSSVTTTL